MTQLLSDKTIEAIVDVAGSHVTFDDVEAACRAYGFVSVRPKPTASNGVFMIPGPSSMVTDTVAQLDLADPDTVGRLLRFVARLSELYQASPKANATKLVRLRNALSDDGFSIEPAGDVLASLTGLAATATSALGDVQAIKLELARLEAAIPSDPGAAIGRAKNLVEATAKAILRLRGKPISDSDSVPTLVAKASEALGLHPRQASPERKQVLNLLGRLNAITQDLAELRNAAGDGHGAAQLPEDVTPSHGRLAARSAIAWCAFMIEQAIAPPR